MPLTQDQQTIFDAVITALRTNSKTIDQLTPQASLADSDYFELNGGRKVSYATMKSMFAALSDADIVNLNQAITNAGLKGVSIALTATGATLTVQSEGKIVSCAIPVAVYNSAADGEKKAGLMSAEDKHKLDATVNDRENDRGLINDLQRWGQEAGWMVQRVTHGKDDASDVYARLKMHKMDEPDSEPSYSETVIAPAATEEAAGAMTAQQVKDLKLAKGFMATKGRAEGLAPLDADKHVPDENIAPKFFDVLMFDSVLGEEVTVSASSSTLGYGDEGAAIVYSSKLDRFLLKITQAGVLKPKYCNNFRDSERYGTLGLDGVCPVEGKIYIEAERGYPYVWYDLMLFHIDHYAWDLVDALESTKGRAEGIAPLDANKLIPEANIPQKYDNIIFFDSVQAGAIVTQPGSALLGADDEKATLIFSKARNRFVLGVAENAGGMPQKYYVNFPGSDRYGTPKVEGIRPASDKVYICRSTSLAYVWNGTTLAALVEDYSSEFQNISADILEINESKGEPNGIAPLDANKLIPEEHIPATFRNVAHFAEVIDRPGAVSPGTAPGAVGDDEVDVVFCEATKRFLFRHTPADGLGRFAYFYKIDGWQKLGESSDENGVIPSAGKLYVNDKQGDALYWHGNALRPLRPAIKESDDIHTTIANPGTAGQSVQLNLTEAARKSLFCDLFTAAAGSAGYAKFTNGVWDCKLNGLTLSYNEAVEIYKYGITSLEYGNSKFANYQGRTTLPIRRTQTYDAHGHTGEMFYNAAKLEVVGMDLCTLTRRTFYGCSALRTILGVVQVIYDVPADTFKGCTSLVDIGLRVVHPNPVNLGDSPLLSLDSVTGMVNHSAAETSFTVHPDVYAKLTGDTTNEAAAALTAEELSQWQALLTKAAGKHIAFASA